MKKQVVKAEMYDGVRMRRNERVSMKDQYQREIDYLRVSVTDACNFCCEYCKPSETKSDEGQLMTLDELFRICRISSELGIHAIKITGGEPLLRPGIVKFIKNLKDLPGIDSVTMTTNGFLLKDKVKELKEAKIDCITVSLDSLDNERFYRITKRDVLETVLEAIDSCLMEGIRVKVNCVVTKDFDEWTAFYELAKNKKVDVRFIEMMPFGPGKQMGNGMENQISKHISSVFDENDLVTEKKGSGPAVYYKKKDMKGSIGVIDAVSHSFCASCNRIRITSHGMLKPCLANPLLIDIKHKLRTGATDIDLMKIIASAIFQKPVSHQFHDAFESSQTEVMEQSNMYEIGG